MAKDSSPSGDSGRISPDEGGADARRRRKEAKCRQTQSSQAEPHQKRARPMGKRCRYEETFLPPEEIMKRCKDKGASLLCAAQVVILQRLMQERKWRQSDLVRHSKVKRCMLSCVLKVERIPTSNWWQAASDGFDLKLSDFDRMAEVWLESENLL